eukprot:TRINITY_DN82316_c0_g1_i1.p1 TRINITY_DN82316_c0_g1~~TRINITY_DN82316_c0_g1_i1.p1  ORF type:complete len:168 (+),score=31.59 TRINITY_DN82316_c0_g1_i1:22-504(+)
MSEHATGGTNRNRKRTANVSYGEVATASPFEEAKQKAELERLEEVERMLQRELLGDDDDDDALPPPPPVPAARQERASVQPAASPSPPKLLQSLLGKKKEDRPAPVVSNPEASPPHPVRETAPPPEATVEEADSPRRGRRARTVNVSYGEAAMSKDQVQK